MAGPPTTPHAYARDLMGLDKAACPIAQAILKGDNESLKRLLADGANPNRGYQETKLVQSGLRERTKVVTYSALQLAIADSRTDMVEALLDAGANPNFTLYNKGLPLSLAVKAGKHAMARALIKAGARVDNDGVLATAARNADKTMVELLLDHGANPNQSSRTENLRFPLMYALKKQDYDIFQLLLDHGANPAFCLDLDGLYNTAFGLLGLAMIAERPDFLDALFATGTLDPNGTYSGEPLYHGSGLPMDIAAQSPRGHLMVPVLLAHGVGVEIGADKRTTPVAYAAENMDCPAVLPALLDAGFDPDPHRHRDRAPVDRRNAASPLAAAIRCGNLPGVNALLNAGAPVHNETLVAAMQRLGYADAERILIALISHARMEQFNETLIAPAKTTQHAIVIRALQAAFPAGALAEQSVEDSGGYTPLLQALCFQRWPATRLQEAIRAGASVTTRDQHGRTALHVLASAGCSANAPTRRAAAQLRALLDAGADPNAQDNNGATPLDCLLATNNLDDEVATLRDILIEHGARPPEENTSARPCP